jgi:general secretion pathway protein G
MAARRRPLIYIRAFRRTVLPALRPLVTFFAAIGLIVSLGAILSGFITICAIPAGSTQFSVTRFQLDRLGKALEQYRTDCGNYPDLQLGLNALVTNPGAQGWNGPYFKDPLVDAWGRPYLYSLSGGVPTVRSLGADGKSGGDLFDTDLSSQDPFAPIRESRLHAAEDFFASRVAPWLVLAVSTYGLLRSRRTKANRGFPPEPGAHKTPGALLP